MAETKEILPSAEPADMVTRAKGFWDKFSKPIIYIGSAFILTIGGWYAYQNFILLPKEKKAAELIYPAENFFDKMASTGFSKDSVSIVLNGGVSDGINITGMLKIISQYGGTKSGNRAKFITGASYLQIKEYNKAIKYLEDFDAYGAEQIESKADILLGHAYAELKNTEKAFNYYKKAASVNSKDESITPYAMFLAASYADANGKSKEAIELYKKIKENYPNNPSVSSGDIEKYLARLGVFE